MFARINGIELFYSTQGSGFPLMFMHGGMGFDHASFRPWLDPLSEKMELIYYDHRGNGRSTPLDNFNGVDHGTWADDADALRKHLGHDKIVLLGHSCGGFVALEYARRYGENLLGLVLCCTTPAMDYPDVITANAQTKATPEMIPLVMKLFTTPLASNEEMRSGLGIILPLYFKNYNAKVGAQIVNSMKLNYHALNHCTAAWFPAVDFTSRLGEIDVPTLIIAGKEDWIMPPAQGGERLHTGIRNSELVIFENSGHYPFIEEQELFVRTVRDWVAKLK